MGQRRCPSHGCLCVGDKVAEEDEQLLTCRAWTNDTPLVALAVAHGRTLGLDRIWSPRKTHDDWREWIYLSIMDHLQVEKEITVCSS